MNTPNHIEDDTPSETQYLDPESSAPYMLESKDAQKLECYCLLIALSRPRTLESSTPGTLSPNESGEEPQMLNNPFSTLNVDARLWDNHRGIFSTDALIRNRHLTTSLIHENVS